MSDVFENDLKDRKRRFLRGLNALMGLGYNNLENKEIIIKEAISIPIHEFKKRLADTYGLEFKIKELTELIKSNITTGDFTKKYVRTIYSDRGKVDLNSLIDISLVDGAIDLAKLDSALKYGLNGSQWCDVAEGPCSCGAWH